MNNNARKNATGQPVSLNKSHPRRRLFFSPGPYPTSGTASGAGAGAALWGLGGGGVFQSNDDVGYFEEEEYFNR